MKGDVKNEYDYICRFRLVTRRTGSVLIRLKGKVVPDTDSTEASVTATTKLDSKRKRPASLVPRRELPQRTSRPPQFSAEVAAIDEITAAECAKQHYKEHQQSTAGDDEASGEDVVAEVELTEADPLNSDHQAKKQRVEDRGGGEGVEATGDVETRTAGTVEVGLVMDIDQEESRPQECNSGDISTVHATQENEQALSGRGTGEAGHCEVELAEAQAKLQEDEKLDALAQTSAPEEEEDDSRSSVAFTDTASLPGAVLAIPEDPESGEVEVSLVHKSLADDYFTRLWRLKSNKKGPRIGPKYQHEVSDIPDNFQPNSNQIPLQDTVPCVWRPMTDDDALEAYLEQARRIVRLEVQNRIRSADGDDCQGLPKS
jgi:hypothetical protein